jgi:hypothetical protein
MANTLVTAIHITELSRLAKKLFNRAKRPCVGNQSLARLDMARAQPSSTPMRLDAVSSTGTAISSSRARDQCAADRGHARAPTLTLWRQAIARLAWGHLVAFNKFENKRTVTSQLLLARPDCDTQPRSFLRNHNQLGKNQCLKMHGTWGAVLKEMCLSA